MALKEAARDPGEDGHAQARDEVGDAVVELVGGDRLGDRLEEERVVRVERVLVHVVDRAELGEQELRRRRSSFEKASKNPYDRMG